jgi:aminopeptidase N
MLAAVLLAPRFVRAQEAPSQPPPAVPPSTTRAPSRADVLRGEYGRYRANNDLLHYVLDVRVDPERRALSGSNTIRFRMLKDDTRIQLELHASLQVDRILFDGRPPSTNVTATRSTWNFPSR